ncbi:CELLULOSE SYNTHASE LIKE D5, cellulose synthase-like D5, SALT OVERLY SENSITIVE 6 [Hibiscus trionum]|uniref:CELLULOSE SYNTHASE LIKE D5, cellulose synthase-like D5, SALT OVERLY SENSITIVE 6 n=1 Tax=Hibiscus trionum TaxID=183268 RepID=A0A9W7LQX7_HIBTR|nr:CELLULOSE SYNTHASE LIKE D5, cellulose synthase-like D5, SALT OVERLY SENSITIVE 6 [Hibiscus trionum]
MVKSASSPVTITVSSAGKESGSRSMGLTSPIPRRASISSSASPLGGGGNRRASSGGRYSSTTKDDPIEEMNLEFVSYTVHIPPTTDHRSISASQTSLNEGKDGLKLKPERSFISGTIFTGGYNSVTRGHVIDCSLEKPETMKSGLICGMRGCDEKVVQGQCECGFKICRDCYLDCVGSGGGRCPGCKEPYKDTNDGDDDEDEVSSEEEEDRAFPLPSIADFKLDKRLSLVKSFKGQNHQPDFDHTRWLFETKGTYGYGNAVWPKDGYGAGSGTNGHRTLQRDVRGL